jgi:hypothetical protein
MGIVIKHIEKPVFGKWQYFNFFKQHLMKNNDDKLPQTYSGADQSRGDSANNGFWGWVKRNKLVSFLLLVIIIGGLFFIIRINLLQRDVSREKAALESHYEMLLDSLTLFVNETIAVMENEFEERLHNLHIAEMKRSTRILSWAVRSEMTRQNMEQVNLFFSNLIRDPRIVKIKLIHPADGRVILSTDQKDHGEIISEDRVVGAEVTFSIPGEETTVVVTPVMGLEARIGVLQVIFTHRKNAE